MAKFRIKAGDPAPIVYVFIQDSSSTTGAGLSGLDQNSGITARYVRKGDLSEPWTLSDYPGGDEQGAYVPNGFIEVGSMPGLYRVDLPAAAVGAGVDTVTCMMYGATNMAPVLFELQLDDMTELSGGPPAIDADMVDMIKWIYTQSRNKVTQNATTQTLRNDADSGTIATSATSDDATTFTRGKWSP